MVTHEPINIGVDITALQSPGTGVRTYITNILDILQDIDTHNKYFLFECRPSGYHIRNPLWTTVCSPNPIPLTIWMLIRFPTLMKQYRLDVFWASRQWYPVTAPRDIKVVCTIYDFVHVRFPQTMHLTSRLIYKALVGPSLAKAAYLTPISEYIRKEAIKIYPQLIKTPTMVVPCGSPGAVQNLNVKSNRNSNHLFFAGNFEPRKNLLNVVKALEILHPTNIRPEVRIAGPAGWANSKCHDYIRNSRVRDQFTFLGYIDRTQLFYEYQTCKALIYPSLYEGFGLPVLEAFSADCIVLTSRNTAMEEIAGDAAIYFDPYDPIDIARTIEHLYTEKFNAREHIILAQKVISRYSWEESAAHLLSIFKHLGQLRFSDN